MDVTQCQCDLSEAMLCKLVDIRTPLKVQPYPFEQVDSFNVLTHYSYGVIVKVSIDKVNDASLLVLSKDSHHLYFISHLHFVV